MPINIPKGDTQFDPFSTGKEKMAFIRSEFNRCTSRYTKRVERKQENKITAFIDANMVYGEDFLENHRQGVNYSFLGLDLGIFSGFHGISWDSCFFLNKILDLSFDILVKPRKLIMSSVKI